MDDRYQRYTKAVSGEPLPLALVDLDAVDRNIDAILDPVRRSNKTLRVASKSIRSVDLLRYIARRGGAAVRGIMAYSPAEAAFLEGQGFDDILVAYPTAQPEDARKIAEANRRGATVSLAVDAIEHLDIAAAAADRAGARIPVIVDIDVSYRPIKDRLHIGVRRSPLRTPDEVAAMVHRIEARPSLRFAGLLAYEAHLAGVPDHNPDKPALDLPTRALKYLARRPAIRQRRAIRRELERRGIAVPLFNGGGTGSVALSARDDALTEITAGSGFLDSHLFDHYAGLSLSPAAFFAIQVTRRPRPGMVTCQGGGLIASGAAGADRLPKPYLPAGLSLTGLEGAGEVQTPLLLPEGMDIPLGAPVFFRHAKAGELAERFQRYLLVRGDRVEGEALTYRGAGQCFG